MQRLTDVSEEPLAAFDYQPRTRLIFGVDGSDRVGELVQEHGGRHVLLVTDPGIVAAGHADRVRKILEKSGLAVAVFEQVRVNPTTECVDRCVEAAKNAGIDFIVGLGGGSSMDTAKGCNFILTNGGRMRDYRGLGKATKPMLPLIAIPTTAGTGSECQSFALIADPATHAKMACGDPKAAARVAILDPKLTLSQPRQVTACTGIDAIAHAVETSVTLKRNPLSLMYSHRAFRLMARAFPKVLESPDDLDARANMLLGAAFAGTAIENSMLGAAHSAANPLTARYDIVHGQAVGMMLPGVVQFNGEDESARAGYAALARTAGLADSNQPDEIALKNLIGKLRELLSAAALPQSLSQCAVDFEKIATLAEEASTQWTAQFNPRPLTKQDFIGLYQKAYSA